MKKQHYRIWFWLAPVSLVLIGAGVSISIYAGTLKFGGSSFWHWVGIGTVGLIVLNSGISLFGRAVIHRVHYEREKKD